LVDHLEESGVIPYAIPLMVPADKSEKLVSVLKDNNFETGVYFFDLNRFMLEPDFVKTVLIPCHSGISDNNLDKLIGLIKTIINN
jgi:hypothetical protein